METGIPGICKLEVLNNEAIFKGLAAFPQFCCIVRLDEAAVLTWHLELAVA